MSKFFSPKKIDTKKSLNKYLAPDSTILILVLILTISGLAWILDASAVIANDLGYFYYFERQLIFIIVGSILGFVAYKFFDSLQKYFWIILIVISGLLILVLVPGIAKEVNGAYRWIKIGGIDIQPSEFAKPVLIVYLAIIISKFNKKLSLNYFKTFFDKFKFYWTELWLPYSIVLSVSCILIFFEKDLGTVIVIALTSICLLYTGSGKEWLNKVFTIVLLIIVGIVGYFSIYAFEYRIGRFEIYKELFVHGNLENLSQADRLGKGYQLEQILVAIGSGGVTGVGFTESKQKYFYLVDQTSYTDTIFAVISEETGLIGSMVFVSLYFIFLYRGMKVSGNIYDPTMMLIAYGIVYWITIQSLFNISANLSILPLKGLTLPFLSYGGSSIISLLTATGIFLHASRYRENSN